MKQTEIIKAACRLLKKRVRYETAALRLPGTEFPKDDTAAIVEATRLYTETWIVPLLEAIESGNMPDLRDMLQ